MLFRCIYGCVCALIVDYVVRVVSCGGPIELCQYAVISAIIIVAFHVIGFFCYPPFMPLSTDDLCEFAANKKSAAATHRYACNSRWLLLWHVVGLYGCCPPIVGYFEKNFVAADIVLWSFLL